MFIVLLKTLLYTEWAEIFVSQKKCTRAFKFKPNDLIKNNSYFQVRTLLHVTTALHRMANGLVKTQEELAAAAVAPGEPRVGEGEKKESKSESEEKKLKKGKRKRKKRTSDKTATAADANISEVAHSLVINCLTFASLNH